MNFIANFISKTKVLLALKTLINIYCININTKE